MTLINDDKLFARIFEKEIYEHAKSALFLKYDMVGDSYCHKCVDNHVKQYTDAFWPKGLMKPKGYYKLFTKTFISLLEKETGIQVVKNKMVCKEHTITVKKIALINVFSFELKWVKKLTS